MAHVVVVVAYASIYLTILFKAMETGDGFHDRAKKE